MKVLHVLDSLRPENGGPPAVVTRLAAAQVRAGISPAVTFNDGHLSRQHADWWIKNVPEFSGVALRPCGLQPARLGQLVRQFDIVHVHGIWKSFPTLACWQAEHSRVPTVIAPHGMLSTWSLNQKRLKKILAMKLIWHRLLCDTTVLHALNHAEESELRARFPTTAIDVIPNGIFAEEFNALPVSRESSRLVPALCGGRRFILFLARLHYMKGPDLLLDAFARIAHHVPDLDLIIAGPDFGMKQGLEAQIAKAGLLTRVHMPGAVYGREKLALLHDAECLCQPSRHEGFSITMLEALACGLPVITTKNANFDEIGTAGAGIIAGADAESLSTAVLRLTTNSQSRIEQSERARELVMRCYTWPAIEQRLRNVYSKAVLEASGGTS